MFLSLMEMGDIIKKLRLEAGITQEKLGSIIGVQKSAIRKYEKGEVQNIKRSSIQKMADFFNVSPSYLMGLSDEKETSTIEKAILDICSDLEQKDKIKLLDYALKLKRKG